MRGKWAEHIEAVVASLGLVSSIVVWSWLRGDLECAEAALVLREQQLQSLCELHAGSPRAASDGDVMGGRFDELFVDAPVVWCADGEHGCFVFTGAAPPVLARGASSPTGGR
jgi:hypothetical protein